jgi:hypothetical protein
LVLSRFVRSAQHRLSAAHVPPLVGQLRVADVSMAIVVVTDSDVGVATGIIVVGGATVRLPPQQPFLQPLIFENSKQVSVQNPDSKTPKLVFTRWPFQNCRRWRR